MIKTIAESTAAQKDELLLALFESSLYGIMLLKNVYNKQGIIEDFEFRAINPFAEGILGKTVPEGSKFNEVFEQAKETGIFQTYVEVATQKTTTLSFESLYPISSEAEGRWFKQKVAAHNDGIVVTFEDITSQRDVEHLLLETKEHAEETENKYLALVNSMQQGFCIIEMLFDEDGHAQDYRYIEANPAFAKQTGLSLDVIGRTMRELVPEHEQHWYDIYGNVVRTRKAGTFGAILKTGGAMQVRLANTATAINVSGITGITSGELKNVLFMGDGTFKTGTFSSRWEVESTSLTTEKDDVATGNIYISTSTATTFTAINTPTKILGTTTAANLFRVTSPQNNRLVYTGRKTRRFQVICSLSMIASANNKNFSFYIYKNGSPMPESKQVFRLGSNTDRGSVTLSCTVDLTTNQYIEVWAENNTDNTQITVESLNLAIK